MTNYSRSVLKSNGYKHPEIRLKKFEFSLKTTFTNITKKLSVYSRLKSIFFRIFNFAHKRFTFAFTSEIEYTLGFRRKIAHSGSHGETGVFRTGALLLLSERSTRFGSSAWPGIRTANFAVFGSWPGVLPKNTESLRDSDALMRVAVPRRRGPAGLRDLFSFLSKLRFSHSVLRVFPRVQGEGWYHYPQCALRVVETPDGRLPKRLICHFLRSGSLH